MKRSIATVRLWLAINFAGLLVIGFVAYAVQQNYRQSANDPQIQLAEDTAAALDAGRPLGSLVPAGTPVVNMRTSLAPYLIVLDNSGRVLASSGRLDGRSVIPPAGVLHIASSGRGKDTTQPHEDRITWQPAPGVRQAAVIVAHHGGYVVAARSLREVEIREDTLRLMTVLAAAALLIGTSLIFWFG